MKKILNLRVCFALLLAVTPLVSRGTVFFSDNFTTGLDTTNKASIPGPGPNYPYTYTSFDIAAAKGATTNDVFYPSQGFFHAGLNGNTTSGFWEYQACFAPAGSTNAVTLTTNGDYIEYSVTFTNISCLMNNPNGTSGPPQLWLGLYNSFGNLPLQGQLSSSGLLNDSSSPYANGNCASWEGYASQITSNCVASGSTIGSACSIFTRPIQNGTTGASSHQDLVCFPANTGSFKEPVGTQYVITPATSFNLASNGLYTLVERITLVSNACVTVSNALVDANNNIVVSQATTNIVGAGYLTSTFDGMAFGALAKNTSSLLEVNITQIKVQGVVTPYNGNPIIVTQPANATCPSGAACVFSAQCNGVGLTYQWYRNGTKMTDGGNISGSSGSIPTGSFATLYINPVGAGDVESGANGYYCQFSNPTQLYGTLSTNTTTNSLTLGTVHNLTWSGSGSVWNLGVTADWNSSQVFNYGDNVTFDDTGASLNPAVSLSGSYLSASSVTVASANAYTLAGSGNFAGPGYLMYKGNATGCGLLVMNGNFSYTGGTIVSNAAADLILSQYAALGSGPVTLAKAGGTMELTVAGNSGIGVQGTVNVNDNFVFLVDQAGSYGGVLLGNMTGTSGKALAIVPAGTFASTATNCRVRLYGDATVYNGNLNLSDSTIQWACYEPDGSQVYNGVISGPGSLYQRDAGTTYLNGANTYTGGTYPTTGIIALGLNSNPTSGTVINGPLGAGPLSLSTELPGISGTGQLIASGGARTIANSIVYPTGTNNLTLLIGGTNALTLSCATINLAGVDGVGFGYTASPPGSPTNRIFQVTNTALTTISGSIADGALAGYGLTKYGNGVLSLTGTESYTGPTYVTNCGATLGGALWINGTLSSSVVTVQSNGVLSGTGTISSAVNVATNGYIGGGASSIGTLNLGSTLTFSNGGAIFRVNHSGLQADKVSVAGTINNVGAGTIVVTNVGAALVPGDTFTVFNKAVTGGSTMIVTGAGVTWTNLLASASNPGQIQVLSTNRVAISGVVTNSGTNLFMSWPPNDTGWLLQSNSVSLNTTTNWITIPNSNTTNNFTVTINHARTNVFYRLISQ
jgi:autotransporter-associated beta strand protein